MIGRNINMDIVQKNKTGKKKITGMQSTNYYTIQWFKSNKSVVLANRSGREIPFICKSAI
jgi:hypothetical protein